MRGGDFEVRIGLGNSTARHFPFVAKNGESRVEGAVTFQMSSEKF